MLFYERRGVIMFFEIIGFIAAIITTSSFIPQAVKTVKTKNTKGISLIMYVIFVFGVALWLVYGFGVKNYQIILANGFGFILASIVLYHKVKNVLNGEAI